MKQRDKFEIIYDILGNCQNAISFPELCLKSGVNPAPTRQNYLKLLIDKKFVDITNGIAHRGRNMRVVRINDKGRDLKKSLDHVFLLINSK